MSQQIQFKSGQAVRYIATRSFTLGLPGNQSFPITNGMELDYDGTYVTANGHPPMSVPQLRGAVKQGWVVPEADYDSEDQTSSIPRSAGISMRNADGGNPMDPQKPRVAVTTVDAEEREVGDVRSHAKATRDRNATPRGQRLSSTLIEDQDGVPVRSLSTPTHQTTNLADGFGEAVRAAGAVKVRAGQGRTREDLLNSMTNEEQETYLSDMEARRTSRVEQEDPQVLRERARNEAALARRVVGQAPAVRNQVKEGFNVTNTVGNGIETVDMGGTGGAGPDQVEVTEVEGIRITNTNGPKRSAKVAVNAVPAQTRVVATLSERPSKASFDARRMVAKTVCPDFPDLYNFDDTVRKKVARVQADFEERPDIIRAIFAAESDDMKNRLLEEFPEAFSE